VDILLMVVDAVRGNVTLHMCSKNNDVTCAFCLTVDTDAKHAPCQDF
jgi:hypothetical protein